MPTPGNNTKGPNLTPEPPASEIDAELAAMLDREVHAGAPPQDDTPVSVSRHDQWGEPGSLRRQTRPGRSRALEGRRRPTVLRSTYRRARWRRCRTARRQMRASTCRHPWRPSLQPGSSGKTSPAKASSTPVADTELLPRQHRLNHRLLIRRRNNHPADAYRRHHHRDRLSGRLGDREGHLTWGRRES